MYTRNFIEALNAFDAVLDRLAKNQNNDDTVIDVEYSDSDGNHRHYCNKDNKCCCKNKKIGRNDILSDIKQVIFNEPATIVTFTDGSKVCVKATGTDTFSKEVGLMYALVKRLYANDIDDNGYFKSKGLGEKINKVLENAIDQKEISAKAKAERETKKRAKKEAEAK